MTRAHLLVYFERFYIVCIRVVGHGEAVAILVASSIAVAGFTVFPRDGRSTRPLHVDLIYYCTRELAAIDVVRRLLATLRDNHTSSYV